MRSLTLITVTAIWLAWNLPYARSDTLNEHCPALSPLQAPTSEIHELHEVFLTVQYAPGEPDTARHREEEKSLLERMSRDHGRWNAHHPRHRLLQALYGFSKFEDLNRAELSRWRGFYSKVSKRQKKVCLRQQR